MSPVAAVSQDAIAANAVEVTASARASGDYDLVVAWALSGCSCLPSRWDKDLHGELLDEAGAVMIAASAWDLNKSADRANAIDYVLLDDQPVIDQEKDCLDSCDTAQKISHILRASVNSKQPFVMAVDAAWGMGKSTLLKQIRAQLEPNKEGQRGHDSTIKCIEFNAWTAENSSVLHSLIAALASQLDPKFARRWAHRLARNHGLLSTLRISFAVIAAFFKLSSTVDAFMTSLLTSSRTPYEMRESIQKVLNDWLESNKNANVQCAMAVFVDDIDRCSDETIVQVCEAIKLYLDMPGIIFILACDLLVLARGVSSGACGSRSQPLAYLEKIIQVAYRVPAPNNEQVARLVGQCSRDSGTHDLIDDAITKTLAERTNRNPRRIKRLINSFTLEYALDPSWAELRLGAEKLIKCVLLYQLYPVFYQYFVGDSSPDDPIGYFLDYVDATNNPNEQALAKLCKAYGVSALGRDSEEVLTQLQKVLPESLPELAYDRELISLLKSLGSAGDRKAIRVRLINSPLRSEGLLGLKSWQYKCSVHECEGFLQYRDMPLMPVICPNHPNVIMKLVHNPEAV